VSASGQLKIGKIIKNILPKRKGRQTVVIQQPSGAYFKARAAKGGDAKKEEKWIG